MRDYRLETTFDVKFTSRRFTTGAPFALASGVISAYPDNSTTQLTAGLTLSADFDGVTGLNNVRVVATAANGYAAGSNYALVITTGTVDSVSVVGEVVAEFSLEAQSPLLATVSGRKLDVSTGGEAGVDWANVGSPTTTVGLSGTTVKTATDVETDTADIQARLPAALGANGNIKADVRDLIGTAWLTPGTAGTPDVNVKLWNALTTVALPLVPTTAGRTLDVSTGGEAGLDWANIGSPTTAVNLSATNIDVDQIVASVSGAVGSVTGAVGSVTGAVGSVTGAVGSVTGNVGGTINGLTAVALKDFFDTDSTTTYASAVAGSVVKEIADNAGGSALTVQAIVDGVWNEDATGHQTQGTFGHTVGDQAADTDSIWSLANTNLDAAMSTRASAAALATVQADTDDIQTRLPAALSGGNMKVDVLAISGDTTAADNAEAFFDGTGYAGTGNVIPLVTVTTTATTATNVTTVNGLAANVITAASMAADASAEIADQVWDEAIAGHLGAGTTGLALNSAGSAGDPWATAIPGAYGAGTAGKIVGDNVNATISSRATQTSVDTIDDFLDTEVAAILAAVDTEVGAIKTKTDFLPSATAGAAGGVFIAGTNAATAITTGLTSNVIGNITGNLSGSVGSVTGAVGSVTAEVTANVTKLSGDATAADNAEAFFDGTGYAGTGNTIPTVTTVGTLTTYTGNTPQTGDVFPLASTEIADIKAKTDLIPAAPASTTNITAGTITTVTNLTNAPTAGDLTATMKASVTAAVPTAVANADALLDRDMATGTDSGSPTVRTVRQALRFLRNKWAVAAGTLTVRKEDDTTASWTATVSTDAAALPVIGSDPA